MTFVQAAWTGPNDLMPDTVAAQAKFKLIVAAQAKFKLIPPSTMMPSPVV
jgi:hypothetical protein